MNKNKKAQMPEMFRIFLWIVVLIILGGALFVMFKKLTG